MINLAEFLGLESFEWQQNIFAKGCLLCYNTILPFFPTTLEEYDLRPKGGGPLPQFVILLSREIGETRFLPTAFYLLPLYHENEEESYKTLMSDNEKAIYFEGKQQLATIWPRFVQEEWVEWSGCTDSPRCDEGWKGLSDDVRWRALFPWNILQPYPLADLKFYEEMLSDKRTALCKKHRRAARARVREKRAEVWDSLPGIFQLGTWDALAKENMGVIGAHDDADPQP
ncbi:hypothetical protein K439DRAFT_1167035 [Ramaria rubella]|nr:hypothetical protein K439DRAFT_1167035 [Ramaria rubella]